MISIDSAATRGKLREPTTIYTPKALHLFHSL
jgi:hypothetical protein